MEFLIVTHGRADNQITYDGLPSIIQEQVKFVVQECEAEKHPDHRRLIVLPPHIKTLPATRQWLLENCSEQYILMMDDDLRFNVRRPETGAGKLYTPTEEELLQMFAVIEVGVVMYPMFGISQREGNHREELELKEVCRSTGMFAIDRKYGLDKGLRFDRTKTKEDMDYCLQLLTSGAKNAVSFKWTREAGMSQAPGGCATYRTHEMMTEDANHFASLWPGLVTVREKKTKGSWGGGVRTDVMVYWKKAFSKGAAQ